MNVHLEVQFGQYDIDLEQTPRLFGQTSRFLGFFKNGMTMRIEVPKKLSKEQEGLLRSLAELENTQVTPHRKSFLEKLRAYFPASDEAGSDQE